MNTNLIVSAALAGPASEAHSAGTFVYVSNQEDADISMYELRLDGGGQLVDNGRIPAGRLVMPMAKSSDGKYLYASIRTQPYGVAAYLIDASSGKLHWLGTTPLPANLVHLSVDSSGRWLMGTSYATNEIAINPIGLDGRVDPKPSQFLKTGGEKPHSIMLDSRTNFAYVPHLAPSEIRVFRFDQTNGQMTASDALAERDVHEAGFRHMVSSATGSFVYLLGELTGEVVAFSRNLATGKLKQLQRISSVPANAGLRPGVVQDVTGSSPPADFDSERQIGAADIQITPDGRFIYTTERSGSTIAHFAVSLQDGTIKLVGHITTERRPRSIAIDPTGKFLIASGQLSDQLSLYAIDKASGQLALRERVPVGKGANWVEIVRVE